MSAPSGLLETLFSTAEERGAILTEQIGRDPIERGVPLCPC